MFQKIIESQKKKNKNNKMSIIFYKCEIELLFICTKRKISSPGMF